MATKVHVSRGAMQDRDTFPKKKIKIHTLYLTYTCHI